MNEIEIIYYFIVEIVLIIFYNEVICMKKFGYEIGVNSGIVFYPELLKEYQTECKSRNGYLNLFNRSNTIFELLQLFEIGVDVNSDLIIGNFVSDNAIFNHIRSDVKYKDGYFPVFDCKDKSLLLFYTRIDKKDGNFIFKWYYNFQEIIRLFEDTLDFKMRDLFLDNSILKNIIVYNTTKSEVSLDHINEFKINILEAIRFHFTLYDAKKFYSSVLGK